MILPKFNVRFNVYQPTDRDTKCYYGYIYDPQTRKQKKWNTHETIKAEALKRVREKIDEIYGNDETIETVQPARVKTVENVLNKYLAEVYAVKIAGRPEAKKKKLMTSNRSMFKNINRWIGPKEIVKLDINDFIHKRQTIDRVANNSILREIRMLKAAINAVLPNSEKLKVKAAIEGHVVIKGDKKTGIIEPEIYEKILSVLPNYMELIVEILYFSGARPSEIRELKWNQIKWDSNTLHFEYKTTKETYQKDILLNDYLMARLEKLKNYVEKDANK